MDKRKSTLGGTTHFHRGFFDNEIQSVLRKRKVLSKHAALPLYERRIHLAWPLIALSDVGGFSTGCLHGIRIYENPFIQFCYKIDPVFTAELFLAITLFEERNPDPGSAEASESSKVSLIEALLWCEPPKDIEQSAEDGKLFWGEIADWKTLGETIERLFPHHKGWATAARLKTEFSREKKRREKILAEWEINFDSYKWLNPSGKDQPRVIQVLNNGLTLDFYAQPSVTKKR